MACAYARNHPDERVIIKDFTETGDLSTLCLGGFLRFTKLRETGVEQSYASHGIVTIDSFCAAAAAAASASSSASLLSLFQRPAAPAPSSEFQMERRLVDLHAINAAMPTNLFLVANSPETSSNAGFDTPAKRALVKQGLMSFYEQDARTWAIFIDTGGDRHFTHRTRMGLALARSIAVPTDINDNDTKRMEFFAQGVREMAEAGEAVPPLDAFILNKVNVVQWQSNSDEGKGVISPFSPAKATVSEIDRVSGQIASVFGRDGKVELFLFGPISNFQFPISNFFARWSIYRNALSSQT